MRRVAPDPSSHRVRISTLTTGEREGCRLPPRLYCGRPGPPAPRQPIARAHHRRGFGRFTRKHLQRSCASFRLCGSEAAAANAALRDDGEEAAHSAAQRVERVPAAAGVGGRQSESVYGVGVRLVVR
jgi:hypothetical protein